MTAKVVTISASVGAGGSIVAPAVAQRLGLEFVDRIIPAAVAASLDVSLDQALAHDEKTPGLISRLLSTLATAAPSYGPSPAPPAGGTVDEEVFRSQTEHVIREAAHEGAVFLGRAAAVVLSGVAGALHVRLDGDRAGRIAHVISRQGVTQSQAVKLVDGGDRGREEYVRHFYRVDPHDVRLYHLTIDSVVISVDTCVELITTAAAAL